MRPGFRLGRILGVEVRVDWSLAIIFALIVVDLASSLFPRWHADWDRVTIWGVAFAAACLFFSSVLMHELSHALVARTQGVRVPRITLFLFGGMAEMDSEPPTPKAELLMTVVGPLTSLAIGVGATLVGAQVAGASGVRDVGVVAAVLRDASPLATLLLWLGPVNIGLAIFNAIPGFPLDGGRVLRAALWWGTGDFTKATRWAAGVGRGFAWLLMILGVVEMVAGGIAQGLWLVLIGWFLNSAAVASHQHVLIARALEDVPVTRIMRTRLDRISPDVTVETLVREHLIPGDEPGVPVEQDGTLVGLVTREDVRKVQHARWMDTRVESVMTPTRRLATLPPDAGAQQAWSEFSMHDVDQIPIVTRGRLLGMVTRRDLFAWIRLHAPQTAGA